MTIVSSLFTDRLAINPLTTKDGEFIFELLNTEGWIRFIGNRNIASKAEAAAYIQRILDNENISYYVITNRQSEDKMGLVTYIKRDYLPYPDVGFAFLPCFSKQGYAYEATKAFLQQIVQERDPTHILATTVPDNVRSIALLRKLGLVFEKELQVEKDLLHLYGASINKWLV